MSEWDYSSKKYLKKKILKLLQCISVCKYHKQRLIFYIVSTLSACHLNLAVTK